MGDGQLPSDPILKVVHLTVENSLGLGVELSRAAKFVEGSSDLTIRNSGSEAHPFPISVGELAIGSLPTGSYTQNRVSEILIDPEVVSGAGGLLESTTMRDLGVPYRMGIDASHDDLQIGARSGDPTAVLTIEPGVTIKFLKDTGITLDSPDGTNTTSTGVVRALGSAAKPIVFTSAAAVPAPGDWRGFDFKGIASADNRLEHVHIAYTGADCSCSVVTCSADVAEFEGALIFYKRPPAAFLVNSRITDGSGHGVVQGWDGPALDWASSNTFQGLAGCRETLPRAADTSCPDPEPVCVSGQ